MTLLRLMKYPGAKSVVIPDINSIFKSSKSRIFVDVFGGSGIVSLNVESDQTVYNDLNPELVNLFQVIKSHPDKFQKKLAELTSSKELFLEFGESINSRKYHGPNDFENAILTFYKFNVGFGGMGDTYSTLKEKSAFTLVQRIIGQLRKISYKIGSWKLENLDFRALIRKYDHFDTFLYLDPPYIGRDWYDFNFSEEDLVDLKELVERTKGRYLLNLNYSDTVALKVFGPPPFVKKYVNQNVKNERTIEYRTVSFYTNVS
jgi:DNA adenine methylase